MTGAHRQLLLVAWLGLSCFSTAEEPKDWRLELLAAEKIPTDTESLKAFSKTFQFSEEKLTTALKQLGANQFSQRQQAQNEILLMGRAILPQLRKMPLSSDPEARSRLEEIIRNLETNERCSKDEMLRLAVNGLLQQRENPDAKHASQKIFVEMFTAPADSLSNGYHSLSFVASAGKDGKVDEGMARLWGSKDKNEGDQRLVLDAKTVTGAAEFPNKFQIEAKIGGCAGGEAAYHVGISVGNVRALFHPGHEDGGFRIERVDNHLFLVPNKGMGFDPPADTLLRMQVKVERLSKSEVKMDVVIINEKDQFRHSAVLRMSDVGKLDKISIDRSGREGGDAIFDDLLVDFSGN
jgi:hypothetical protein